MRFHFLNDVAYDAESTHIENYVISAGLKSETMGKLINRMSFDIKFTRLCFENVLESLGKPRDVNKRPQSITW